MDEQREIVTEFLIESSENLGQLDRDFVELERQPDDRELLSSIFRTIHTIKGTCGFLGFSRLEALTHRAENLLSQLREGDRRLTPELTTLLLETVDAVKGILTSIEQSGAEGEEGYSELLSRLEQEAGGELSHDSEAAAGRGEEPEPVEPTDAEPEPEAEPHRSSVADSNIRVDVDLLDGLMNLVGELVLARNQILQLAENQEDPGFTGVSQRLNLITTELQAGVMKTRMQPIGVVWNKFPRVVRDLCQSFGKQVKLEMEGADTELDKTIIEAIKDPLTHIVRNSCDHGIESPEARVAAGKSPQGRLRMHAYHEGGQVNIEIADDGAGIDPERLRRKALQKGLIQPEQAERMSDREALDLIFLQGFSTASQVTHVSGRGVGMDVVRTNIEKIGGSIDLQSRVGEGASIKIKIPLTLAIIAALVIKCGGERFAIPQVNVVELVRVEPDQEQRIELVQGASVYRLRGKLLPLVYLHRELDLEPHREDESVNIVVLQAAERVFGLVVDGVSDTAEIVVKPLSKLLKGLGCYAGATIMGDGRVALILDALGLAQMSGVLAEQHKQARPAAEADAQLEDRQAVLLFRSGDHARLAAPLALVDRLEEFPADRIEQSGGRRVVQYRNSILPLIPLSDSIGGAGAASRDLEKLQTVVFSHGEKRVGVVVDEILDIVEERIQIRSGANGPGLQGSAVIVGQVADFIDLRAVLGGADERWLEDGAKRTAGSLSVLLVEPSAFARGILRGDLETAGHRVVEATDVHTALRRLGQGAFDLLLSSAELPAPGAASLIEGVRAHTGCDSLPALGLTETAEAASPAPFDRVLRKFDCDGLLGALERITVGGGVAQSS